MARKPRLHVEGGFYHVILRGNGGEKIFFSEHDRNRLYLLIQEGIVRFKYRLHGYCLMTNHIHLIIQVGNLPLSKIVQNISFRYTKYINKKKKRIGHLFQGRYKAVLIDADTYLLELVRYIHNNPVRAGMVKNALDYKWSSHQPYLGKQKIPFLTMDLVLGQFGKTVGLSRKKFKQYVERKSGEGQQAEFYKGIHDTRVLGDENFAEKVLQQKLTFKKPSLQRIVQQVCKQFGVQEKELKKPGRQRKMSEFRGIIGWLAKQLEATSLTEVSTHFNRDLATMSRAVRKIEERYARSEDAQNLLDDLIDQLAQ
jgi:REP element-mobilizing transposase RayT